MGDVLRQPYEADDLVGLDKKSLLNLALQQFERWPHEKYRWVPKRDTTVNILKTVLLDPAYGYGKVGELSLLYYYERFGFMNSVYEVNAGNSDEDLQGERSQHEESVSENEKATSTTSNDVASKPQSVMVTLVDRRKDSPFKCRIQVCVEASTSPRNLLEVSKAWLVDAKQLIQAIQASPASVEGPARFSIVSHEAHSDAPIYDIFASIDGASHENCVSYPLKVSSDAVEVHIIDGGAAAASTARPVTSRRRPIKASKGRGRSGSLSSSDITESKVTVANSEKDENIVDYLRELTAKDPDQAYVAEWKFFLEGKGRTHSDRDLIRHYNFAVKFMEKWQDARVTVEKRGECRVLQRHIYKALKRNASWFVPVHRVTALVQQFGPEAENPDDRVVSHLNKGKKSGANGLLELLQDAAARRMSIG